MCQFIFAVILFSCLLSPDGKPTSIELTDTNGEKISSQSLGNRQALVLIFVTTDCPIANSYQPMLARLHEEYKKEGFLFGMVHEGSDQSQEKLQEHVREYSVTMRVIRDADHKIAKQLGATITPEACVVDKDGRVLYQGRLDDLHQGYGKKRAKASREDLRIALQEIAAGKEVSVPKTVAVGCVISAK